MTHFFGRERELELLSQLKARGAASLVLIRGRRGIGKKRLAEEFGKSYKIYRLPQGEGLLKLAQKTMRGKVLIILDEVPQNPSFLSLLITFWDQHLSLNPLLVMILTSSNGLCSLKEYDGFIRRLNLELRLHELPLHHARSFFEKKEKLSSGELFEIFSVTGGIPKYLQDPVLLKGEFETLLGDLPHKRNDAYRKILERLSLGKADFDQICKTLEIKKGGTITQYLKDLKGVGFIAFDYTWDLKTGVLSKLCHYRLKDNYLLSYLNQTKSHEVMTLQLQNLVINNRETLWKKLHIKPEEIVFANPFFQRETLVAHECAIDYLIQTKRNSVYLCKITSSLDEREIEEAKRQFSLIKLPKNFSSVPVLVHLDSSIKTSFFAHDLSLKDLS